MKLISFSIIILIVILIIVFLKTFKKLFALNKIVITESKLILLESFSIFSLYHFFKW